MGPLRIPNWLPCGGFFPVVVLSLYELTLLRNVILFQQGPHNRPPTAQNNAVVAARYTHVVAKLTKHESLHLSFRVERQLDLVTDDSDRPLHIVLLIGINPISARQRARTREN